VELGRRARCSASTVSRIERGRVRGQSLATLRRILEALDAWIFAKIVWRGGELDRLLDADHAGLQERWAIRKRAAGAGWLDRQEVSYNIFGERGSIDDLAYHPPSRTLAVTEIKTGIFDAQATLAKLDEKERLAADIAQRFGWRVDRVVSCLVVAEGRTNRRRIEQHPTLFSRFDCRGRAASVWLRDPTRPIRGLLVFENLSNGHQTHGRRAGRQRVRRPRPNLSVNAVEPAPAVASDSA
jgi:transcriptional regulator with XRE-family HTH domain